MDNKQSNKPGPSGSGQQNEGEGNKTAARHYNQETTEYAKSGKAEQAAKQAEQAVDGAEGKELRQAEREGLKHSRH